MWFLSTITATALFAVGLTPGDEPAKKPAGDAAAAWSEAVKSAETLAIRAVDDAFVADFNKGDGKAIAAAFTEDAEVVEADGTRYEGRAQIEQSFTETFAANPGAKITIEVGSIRFLTADTAKEEGRCVVTPAKGAPVSSLYTTLYVKRDGKWKIASDRDEPDPLVRPRDRLESLAWLVGEWLEEGPDAVARIGVRWSDDGNFLLRHFNLHRQGKPAISVTQRIGWDPQAKQIRSWEFDSEGGFGEGRWSRAEGESNGSAGGNVERWVVKHTGVRPEGTTASATNTLTRERPDRVRWVSTDRVIGDTAETSEESFVFVKVPPSPRVRGQAANAPATTERSPR